MKKIKSINSNLSQVIAQTDRFAKLAIGDVETPVPNANLKNRFSFYTIDS